MGQLKGYPSSLRTLAFSQDGRWLAAAGIGREVFVWDVADSFLAGAFKAYTHNAAAVTFGPDDRVATSGGDQMVRVWHPATLETSWAKSYAPASMAYWIAYSPDGRLIYAASNQDSLTVLSAATGERLTTIAGLGEIVDGLAVSPDGRLLAICQKVKLSVWLADGSRELWQVAANPDRCAAFSPEGKWDCHRGPGWQS